MVAMFRLKFDVKKAKEFVSRLAKTAVKEINKEMKLNIENEKFYEELEILASNMLWNEIYTKYNPSKYQRTYDLYNSPVAVSAGEDIAKVNVVLRGGAIKGTKKSQAYKGKFTYGWFFEHPENSFIPPSAVPSRPFMQVLVNALREKIKERVAMSAKETIKKAIKP